jgi:hypothetical protein
MSTVFVSASWATERKPATHAEAIGKTFAHDRTHFCTCYISIAAALTRADAATAAMRIDDLIECSHYTGDCFVAITQR